MSAHTLTIITGDIETEAEGAHLNAVSNRFWEGAANLASRSIHGTNDAITYRADGPDTDVQAHLAAIAYLAAEGAPRWWRIGQVIPATGRTP